MKEFLKQQLLANKPKIYSLLVQHYGDKIAELGCSLFKDWLCEELVVEESKINMASLYSAIRRMKLKKTENNPNKKPIRFSPKLVNEINEKAQEKEVQSRNFFSNPDTLPAQNSNIREL